MDYDDNDFQSQNLHLAGEGSTKFPPVLSPYALPKFEFDDSLQGHLRFDSLVETEVFLGIESNEDNQWIEDFSRGSSGIEFNTGAAESCSIARRNNVWSEATSSESVEMLLKSVGQEEIIPEQTTIKESDVCDELGILAKQMEPSLKHDGNISSRTGDVIHLQPALLENRITENFSELKEDGGEKRPGVEDSSQTRECEASIDRISSNLDPNAVSEKHVLPLTEDSLLTDGKCKNVNESEINPLIDESRENKTLEHTSVVEIQVDNMITSSHFIPTTCGEFKNQEPGHVINDNVSGLQSENGEGGEHPVVDKNEAGSGVCNTDGPPCLAEKVESMEERNPGNSNTNDVEGPSSMIVKGDSDLQIVEGDSNLQVVEGCSNAVCSKELVQGNKYEDVVLYGGKEIKDQSDANAHEVSQVACKGDGVEDQSKVIALEVSTVSSKDSGRFEGRAIELSSSSAASCASPEPKMDSVVHITYEHSSFIKDKELASSCQLDSETLVNNSDASLLPTEDKKNSKGECDGNNSLHVEQDTSSLTAVSPAELHQETHASQTLKCTNDAMNAEDHGSSSILVESIQICKEKVVSMKVDVHNFDQDVCVNDLDNKEFASHSKDMVCEIGRSLNVDKTVESSSSDGVSTENEVAVLKFDSGTTVMNKSDIALENSDFASCVPTAAVPSLSENGVTAAGDQEDERSPSPVLGFTHVDKKEDEKEETASERFMTASKINPGSEFGKDASSNAAGQQLRETGDQSNAERQDEPQTAMTNRVGQESSKELETRRLLSDSTEKEGVAAEAVLEKSEEVTMKENYEKASLKVSDAKLFPRKDEMLTQAGPLSSEKACYSADQKGLEGKESTIGSGDEVFTHIIVPNAEVEGGSRCTDSDRPTCGSPTVIRAAQLSQSENKGGMEVSAEQNVPLSEVVEGDASKIQSISQDPKGNDAFKSESSFTFEVSSLVNLSGKESDKSIQPFSTIPSAKVSMIVEGSPSTPGSVQRKTKTAQDLSRGSPKVSDGAKGTSVRKPRRASLKGTGKETAKKGSLTPEGTPVQKSERGDKLAHVSQSPSGIGQLVSSNSMQLLTTTASLPDLNSSASPPSVFQQSFTDLQQVQLRAQIFVYGSLIQGVAPDEAHMISAFGGPDGGRSIWENAWRTSVERSHSQKSPSVNPETPPRSGARASDKAVKQSGVQSKGISTPVGRASSKSTSSTIVNPMIPLSSPLWSISTPSCDALQSIGMPRGPVMEYQPALSPLHPYQTPPMRNFVGHNTSWLSQPPFRGPWVASAQTSTVDTSARLTLLPNTEPVELKPVKDQSGPHSSGIKHVSPGPMVHSGAPTSVFAGTAPQLDLKKVTVSPGQHSADPKPRKRKKVSNSEDPGQNALPSQSQTVPVSVPAVTHPSTSFTITTPVGLVSKSTSEKVVVPVSLASSTAHLNRGERDPEPRTILSEETISKVKEAKLHAEEATAFAASAVNHSQELWSQLDKQKYSGLVSDVEAKLASAAVAVAAAASVAKAAAAAAKVASNAALQAKLMADEALASSGHGNPIQNNGIPLSDDTSILASGTPVSILKGEDGTNSSSSIIVAAKEAARKRVEAASAASKRAENLDAIVKAAELAAEAVSQAGKIVCMGDPLPLKELVELGPAGYWKVPQASSELAPKPNNVNGEQLNRDDAGENLNISTKHPEGSSPEKDTQTTNCGTSSAPQEVSKESREDLVGLVDGVAGSAMASGRNSRRQKGRKVSDTSKIIGVVPGSGIGSGSTDIAVHNGDEKGAEASKENSIREGSQVEVFKNEERFKAAWYPANVLSLKDGKAYVGYKELLSEEGLGPVKEWVALEGEGNESPIIRMARPIAAVQFEGTRKRRRAAMGDYCWSVGDRVDAWIQESWCEGVITEKNKKDKTSLTIHFPARNETSVVRAWHLRPSLIWKDGEWIEWSISRLKDSSSHEGDTPQEKRLKLGTAAVEIKGKDKISQSNDDVEPGKTEESRLLGLSENDKVFNIGKNTRDENKPGTLRGVRTGLQKEGSKVIFGVPKPGKKRKFMDVSKHYVADQSRKNNEAKDSAKISKYLMPQASGSRGWRNNSKTDLKEKRVAESKPTVLKSGKPQSVSGRTLHQKDNLLAAAVSASDDGSVSHVENASGKHKTMEFGSFSSTEGAAEGPILYSSLPLPTDAPTNKMSTSNAKSERANKGKLAPSGTGKLSKIEEDKVTNGNSAKSASEVVEPRRSVRRIQPTSRLLEGLQSSLIISKIPSVSHDRSHKSQNKNASRGNNNG